MSGPILDAQGTSLVRGALALLAPTYTGTRSLVVGMHAERVASVVRFFGGEVTHVDGGAGGRDPAAASHGSGVPMISGPLPYPDATFDTVYLGGALDDAGCQVQEPVEAQRRLLREAARVLQPGGMLVALVGNRFGMTELRARVRRAPAPAQVTTAAMEADATRGSHSLAGWRRLVASSGLAVAETRLLYPRGECWAHAAPAGAPLPRAAVGAPANRYVRTVLSVLGPADPRRYLGSHFLVLSRRRLPDGSGGIRPSSLDVVLAAEGVERSGLATLSTFQNSDSACVRLGSRFIKIPLDPLALERVKAHARVDAALRDHPLRAYVPLPATLGTAHGVPYLSCPSLAVEEEATTDLESVERVMDAMAVGTAPARLSETELWERLASSSFRRWIGDIGGGVVYDHVMGRLGEREVQVGLVHGDFHLQNFLTAGGRPYLIDWDRFEERSPRFVDVLLMSLSAQGREDARLGNGRRPPDRMRLLASGQGHPIARRRLYGRPDDLSVAEMIAVFLLHDANWRFRYRGPERLAATIRGTQVMLSLGVSLLRSDAAVVL